jgi:hypothetical protein
MTNVPLMALDSESPSAEVLSIGTVAKGRFHGIQSCSDTDMLSSRGACSNGLDSTVCCVCCGVLLRGASRAPSLWAGGELGRASRSGLVEMMRFEEYVEGR